MRLNLMRDGVTTVISRLACAVALVALLTGCGERELPSNAPQRTAGPAPTSAPATAADAVSGPDGEALYKMHCVACHQANGQGLPPAFPPLAAADHFLDDPQRAAGFVANGLSGPITVNGVDYDAVMPPFGYLSDADIAALLTYALNAWGNEGGSVSAAQVAQARGG